MPLKIYYLDDEKDLCENFSDYFESPKVKVITFTDPKKALEESKLNPPDAFFVDYRLPGTTGDEVAGAMTQTFPIYLVTGDISVKTKYKFKALFNKPFKTEDIQKILDELVKSANQPESANK